MSFFTFLAVVVAGGYILKAWKHWIRHQKMDNARLLEMEKRLRQLERQVTNKRLEERVITLEDIVVSEQAGLKREFDQLSN